MIIGTIKLITITYVVVALLMTLLLVLFNKNVAMKLKWWQLIIFFIMQPFLAFRNLTRRKK